MFHEPYGDHFGVSTNELICAVMSRADASNSLFSLLALMVEMSDALPIEKQFRVACTLDDASAMIRERPAVRGWTDRLGLTPAFEEGTTQCRR